MDLHDYLVILRKRWVSIAAVTATGVAMGVLGWLVLPASYTSQSAVLISVRDGDTAREILGGSTFAASQVQTYAEVARSAYVQQPALEELRRADPTQAPKTIDIDVAVATGTSVIKVSATSSDPREAMDAASAVAKHLVLAVEKLSPTDPGGQPTVIATLIAPAEVPTTASAPKPLPLITVGLLVGLGLGFIQALVRGAIRKSQPEDEPLT